MDITAAKGRRIYYQLTRPEPTMASLAIPIAALFPCALGMIIDDFYVFQACWELFSHYNLWTNELCRIETTMSEQWRMLGGGPDGTMTANPNFFVLIACKYKLTHSYRRASDRECAVLEALDSDHREEPKL